MNDISKTPKVAYRTSSGRPIYECSRCKGDYSARGWCIKSPECADMCQRCEDEVSAVAGVIGLMLMAAELSKFQ